MADLGNNQFVGIQGEMIRVMRPLPIMTKEQALVHAAWLVAIADPEGAEFELVLRDVRNT